MSNENVSVKDSHKLIDKRKSGILLDYNLLEALEESGLILIANYENLQEVAKAPISSMYGVARIKKR